MTKWLKPNTRYTVGRDFESAFVVNSGLVSRNQLEFNVGSTDIHEYESKTSLKVGILSRARSVINEDVYKLSKGVKDPIWLDLTKQARIEIKLKMDDNEEHTVLVIEWHDFVLYSPDDITELCSKGVDLRLTKNVVQATHYYKSDILTLEQDEQLLIALVEGLPILNEKWYNTALTGSITDWFVELDLAIFASTSYLLPNSKRSTLFSGIQVVDFNHEHENLLKHINCKSINLTTGDEAGLIAYIKSQGKPKCLIMECRSDLLSTIFNTLGVKPTTYFDLFASIKNVSTDNLSFYSELKREHIDEASTQPSLRKRRKYEKVSKMHFFDFNATSQKPDFAQIDREISSDVVQVDENVKSTSPDVETPKTIQATPNETLKSSIPLETNESLKYIIPLETNETDNIIEQHKIETAEVVDKPAYRKRPLGDVEELNPNKMPKYVPKVSLVDAIKRTKEDAKKTTNEELGISSTKLDVESELSNLAIVEEIVFKLRTPPNSRLDTNPKYNGRKNFKKFNKNMKLESIVTRSFIDLSTVTIDNEINFVDSKAGGVIDISNAEQKLSKDFSGLMNEVKGFRSDGLFVDEDDESDDEQSYRKKGARSKQPALFVDEDSQSQAKPVKARNSNNTFMQVSVDVDDVDDDDDDDHPKFGFSK